MVWNIFMMHLCIVATLCFLKIISPRNYYIATRTIFPGSMVQSMYLNLTVANFLFVFYILDVKSFRTYRNINISNLKGQPWAVQIILYAVETLKKRKQFPHLRELYILLSNSSFSYKFIQIFDCLWLWRWSGWLFWESFQIKATICNSTTTIILQ